uniref:RNA polymerase sigma factor n=1 Tax=Fulvivirga sp. TaxID=1931237 RepID=UPI00404996B0
MLVFEQTIQKTRKEKITKWYQELFPVVAAYIGKRGGEMEDARELFQEALIIFYEKALEGDFHPNVSDKAYMMGIIKKLWLKQQQNKQRLINFENFEISEEFELKPAVKKMLSFLRQSGEKCMDLLQSFYYEKLSMEQVASRFGYKSERSATVQKFKCLEKVRDQVKQKSLSYEDFLD